ncbi:CPBP family intramembrane metalloprotease [Candidatus Saccharibacteria bacterium]|nr:CPBP family intramembrane metalloprotease [Candidatus Saccharibacteria bacterium]
MEKQDNNKKTKEQPTAHAKRPVKERAETVKKVEQKPTFWKCFSIVAGLLVWVAAVMIAVQYAIIFGLYYLIGREQLTTPMWTTVANALIYSIATFLIIWVPVKFLKKPHPDRTELGLKDLPTWADIGLAPAGLIVYLVLAVILIAIFSNFSFFDANQAQELGYNLINGFDRIVAFFALCIVAPIAEELVFRGWLYAKLRNIIPGKRLSLILSIFLVSVLFGILHGQWNVGVNVFAMSVVLCALREVTGTIYSGILLHMLKNTIAFVLVYILGMG